MVMGGNALQIAQNHAKLRGNVWSRVWVTRCIMAYTCSLNLVMCGNKFGLTEIKIAEGYDNFSISTNMDRS